MSTIAERVAAGAAFLDKRDPGWWDADADPAIDLVTLDLLDGEFCILGQRCPFEVLDQYDPSGEPESRYVAHIEHLTGLDDSHRYAWALDHGFNSSGSAVRDLTAEWKRVITERRTLVTA